MTQSKKKRCGFVPGLLTVALLCAATMAGWLGPLSPVAAARADTVAPAPVDRYMVSVTLGLPNVIAVRGAPGALELLGSVVVVNARTGGSVSAVAAGDGSFLAELAGARGDRLDLHARDAAGNTASPTSIYAGAFTVKNPYMANGFWHVGQAHSHTKYSDGMDLPGALEAAYFDAGYDFVISTDHRGYSPNYTAPTHGMTGDDPAVGGKDLFWISATEISDGRVHMGAWGTASRVPIGVLGTTSGAINSIRSLGGIAIMNHPENTNPPKAWYWHTEIVQLNGYSLVEAFNGNPSIEGGGDGHIRDAIDLADEFQQVWWIGADDCHNVNDPAQFDRFAIVVQTDSASMSERDLIAAADAGRVYTREGGRGPAMLGVNVSGNDVTITMQDVASAYDITWYRRGNEIAGRSINVDTVGSYRILGNEGYIRAEIRRLSDGARAYTQPLFIGNSTDLTTAASHPALVDNNASTIWDAGASTGSFVVDLGTVRTANAIRIEWDGADGQRFNYRVEASESGAFDGEETVVVRAPYLNRADSTLDFFDVYARYLRVTITGQSAGAPSSARIREVEVIDSFPGATHLYVDNIAGSDDNDGARATPWRTFAHARERVRPRDILNLVRTDAPFTESLDIRSRHGGKHAGAKVRIQGDPFRMTRIDARVLRYGVQLSDVRQIEVAYFDVYGASDANVFVHGGGKDTHLRYNRVHDSPGHGVLGRGQFTLGYNLIYRNAGDGIFLYVDGTDAVIRNNVLYGNGRDGLELNTTGNIRAAVHNNIASANVAMAFRRGTNGSVVDSHNCVNGLLSVGWTRLSNVEADPRLGDPGRDDFTLRINSPCIDAGLDLGAESDLNGGPIRDVASVPNTGSPGAFTRPYVDMGAFEVCDQACNGGVCH